MAAFRAARPPRGQEGSITVMFAFFLPVLALMIMLTLDIAQLVFEKIRLQNVADACAYSAATVQAAGLNEIADLNRSAMLEYGKLWMIMIKSYATPFQNITDGESAVQYYQKVFDKIREYQDDANKDFAAKALDVAEKVKKLNLDDKGIKDVSIRSINPRSSQGNPGKLMEYRENTGVVTYMYWLSVPCVPKPCMRQAMSWNDMTAGDERYEGPHDGTMTTTVNSVSQMPGVGSVTYTIAKNSSPKTYSAFELKHAPHDLILAPSVFGRTEELRAYAAAMPTGGNVEWGSAQYKAALVRMDRLDPKPNVNDLSKVLH
jgi:hypothetical protein